MRVIAIVQCRLDSSRLPAKALLDFHGQTMLGRVIARCRQAESIADVVVATSNRPNDDLIEAVARAEGAAVHRGELSDARARLLSAAKAHGADFFIRVTADNPFVEPAFMDAMVAACSVQPSPYIVHDLDAVVYGTASELVDTAGLEQFVRGGNAPEAGREHVTTGLSALPGARVLVPEPAFSDPRLSLTVDSIGHYESAWRAMQVFGHGRDALGRIVAAFRGNGPLRAQLQMRG